MKQSLPDVFLTILMESDPPTILPCIDFSLLQCLILTFLARDMPSQRLKTAILVTVAVRYGLLRYDANVPYFNADLGVGSRFGPLRVQKRLMGQKIFAFWSF